MKLLSLVAACALLMPVSSYAIIGVAGGGLQERIRIKTEQFKGVNLLLEDRLGRSLSDAEKSELSKEFRPNPLGPIDDGDGSLIIRVSDGGPRDKSVVLYCVGYSVGAVWEVTRAVCASWQTGRSYDLVTFGGGFKFEATANIFRMTISFDSSRYASGFDPAPGTYALGSRGGALIGGMTVFAGDSGNKTLSGRYVGLGLGLNFGNISALVIEQ